MILREDTIHMHSSELATIAINGFQAMQKQAEFRILLSKVMTLAPQTVVEIGVGKGGTSWAWSKIPSVRNIIAIDMPNGPWGGGPDESSIKYIKGNTHAAYNFISGDSQGEREFKSVNNLLNIPEYPHLNHIDFLFIDGDHSYEGVKKDYLKYSPLVRKGGLVAFHDICEHPVESGCEVEKFWRELTAPMSVYSQEYERYHNIISEPTIWGGIGLLEK